MKTTAIGPVRYGTDLGRLDPTCGAKKHGTYSTYRRGCRCPHAREDYRIYAKRLREGRREDRLFDACGVRRRIQALWAIGHTSRAIGEAAGSSYSAILIAALTDRKMVTTRTRDAIADAYRQLAGVPGTSERTRRRAAVAGWPSPVQWGQDIDDPNAVPEPEDAYDPDAEFVDEVAVERALAGERIDLTGAELVVALQAGVARGEPLSSLSNRLGVNYVGAQRMLGGQLTVRREQQQRVEDGIRRYGTTHSDYVIAGLLGVNRSTVTRARERMSKQAQQAS